MNIKKHILNTSTAAFAFNDEFYVPFSIADGFRVTLNEEEETVGNYILRINLNTIRKDREEMNNYRNEYITEFELYDTENETTVEIAENNGDKIYLADAMFDKINDFRIRKKYDEHGWMEISLSDWDPEEDLFFAMLTNDEITRPLKELKSMIEKGKEIDGVTDISELINKLNRLMREGGIFTESVHVEIIARNLIRDKNNPTSLPDYSKSNIEPMFISIHNSILTNNSVISALTFERIHQQLRTPSTYKKNGISPYDRLFIND